MFQHALLRQRLHRQSYLAVIKATEQRSCSPTLKSLRGLTKEPYTQELEKIDKGMHDMAFAPTLTLSLRHFAVQFHLAEGVGPRDLDLVPHHIA